MTFGCFSGFQGDSGFHRAFAVLNPYNKFVRGLQPGGRPFLLFYFFIFVLVATSGCFCFLFLSRQKNELQPQNTSKSLGLQGVASFVNKNHPKTGWCFHFIFFSQAQNWERRQSQLTHLFEKALNH